MISAKGTRGWSGLFLGSWSADPFQGKCMASGQRLQKRAVVDADARLKWLRGRRIANLFIGASLDPVFSINQL